MTDRDRTLCVACYAFVLVAIATALATLTAPPMARVLLTAALVGVSCLMAEAAGTKTRAVRKRTNSKPGSRP